jgi:hypothetical protein
LASLSCAATWFEGATGCPAFSRPQHSLYRRPLPQGQGALRAILKEMPAIYGR